jgi:cytochrome c-type biogenesis protein CcmH/NrfG
MEEVKKREIQERIVREYQVEEERKSVHRERLKKIEVDRKTAVLSKIEKKNMMVEEVQR